MIRVGIVGCNYGRQVLLPAFRLDPRCEVVALAGSDRARTEELARQVEVPQAYGDWRQMIARDDIAAIAIAVPPRLQPEIAIAALQRGKALFLEKPLSGTEGGGVPIAEQARRSNRPVAVDFEFTELPAWRRAKALIDGGALGTLRHVSVTWNVENYATRMRLKSWKTDGRDGGGVIGNLGVHSLYYLEHFCGRITEMSATHYGLPGEDKNNASESTAIMAGRFEPGASYHLAISAACYLGSGHRIEFYGEEGSLALINGTADYMRGFNLFHARRPATALEKIDVAEEPDPHPDGRIAPVGRLARRFFDAIEGGAPMKPGIEEGLRADKLVWSARFSNQIGGEGIMVEQT